MESINSISLPESLLLDLESGDFAPYKELLARRLSDISGLFLDQEAVKEILKTENRLIYEFRFSPFPTPVSDMTFGVTRIFPGKVGSEYHMTKGHFHKDLDQPEIYICIRGQGYLLLETQSGEFQAETWQSGTVSHIPPPMGTPGG